MFKIQAAPLKHETLSVSSILTKLLRRTGSSDLASESDFIVSCSSCRFNSDPFWLKDDISVPKMGRGFNALVAVLALDLDPVQSNGSGAKIECT